MKKLTKNGKIVFTITTIIFSVIAYILAGIFGQYVIGNTICLFITLICWGWLFLGQIITYYIIWQ
jgi:hypothetical protein